VSVALLEARDDVGDGTSKANTAILHARRQPGTLESAGQPRLSPALRIRHPHRHPDQAHRAPSRSPGTKNNSTPCRR
jgi:L-2-hydroxyglutarate oxidase LhgO